VVLPLGPDAQARDVVVALGLEPDRITIVGDQPEELAEALREGLEAELCVVSGGLGPTHDDRTVELLARALRQEIDICIVAQHRKNSRAGPRHQSRSDFRLFQQPGFQLREKNEFLKDRSLEIVHEILAVEILCLIGNSRNLL